MTGCATRKTDGTTHKSKKVVINPTKCPGTIWDVANGGDKKLGRHFIGIDVEEEYVLLAMQRLQEECGCDQLTLCR